MNYINVLSNRILEQTYKSNNTKPIIKIAISSIALSVCVMLIAVFVVNGFQKAITNKIVGFGSHIVIENLDNNSSYEQKPIELDSKFIASIQKNKNIKAIQSYASKAGLAKTKTEIQGLLLKGVDKNFDWTFFKNQLVEGNIINSNTDSTSTAIIISKFLADKLNLKLNDKLVVYFIQDPPKGRSFKITGIYDSGLGEQSFDQLIAICDIKVVQKLNNWNNSKITGYEVLLNDFDKMNLVNIEIKNMLPNEWATNTISQRFPELFNWLNMQNMNVFIIITLMLIVALINVLTINLIIILYKRYTIGLLKTLGCNNSNIRSVFFNIAKSIVLKGLLWGNVIALGFYITQRYFKIVKLDKAIYYVSEMPVSLNILDWLGINLLVIITAALALGIPLMYVSKVSPIKVLKFN